VLRRFKVALLMTRAQQRAARQEYDLAMADVRRCYSIIGEEYGSERAPVQLNVLAALTALRTGAYDLSVGCSIVAIVQLREGRGHYNRAERAHLDRYARIVAERAVYLGGPTVPWDESATSREPIPGRVSWHIRNTYPLFRPAH
jgi:hypothetical protein